MKPMDGPDRNDKSLDNIGYLEESSCSAGVRGYQDKKNSNHRSLVMGWAWPWQWDGGCCGEQGENDWQEVRPMRKAGPNRLSTRFLTIFVQKEALQGVSREVICSNLPFEMITQAALWRMGSTYTSSPISFHSHARPVLSACWTVCCSLHALFFHCFNSPVSVLLSGHALPAVSGTHTLGSFILHA